MKNLGDSVAHASQIFYSFILLLLTSGFNHFNAFCKVQQLTLFSASQTCKFSTDSKSFGFGENIFLMKSLTLSLLGKELVFEN